MYASIAITSLIGDLTGTLHIHNSQTLVAPAINSILQVSIYTYTTAVSYIPTSVILFGNTLSLTMRGHVANLTNLTAGFGSSVTFGGSVSMTKIAFTTLARVYIVCNTPYGLVLFANW